MKIPLEISEICHIHIHIGPIAVKSTSQISPSKRINTTPSVKKQTKERSSYITEKLSLQFFPENFPRRGLGDGINKFDSAFELLVLRQAGPDMRLSVMS